MRNIIKAQIFSMSHDICTYISLLIFIAMIVLGILNSYDAAGNSVITGSLGFTITGDIVSLCSIMSVSIFTTRLCGWDFNDKTINYEIMYGHNRSEVWLARSVFSVAVSTLTGFILSIIPNLWFTVANGWGNTVSVGQVLVRLFIFLISLVRFSSVCVLITFLVRNSWAAFLISYLMFVVEAIIANINDFKSYLTSVSSILDIFVFENQSYGFVNGEDIIIFKDIVSGETIAGSIIASVIVTALSVFGSYSLFMKRDIN